MNSDDNRPPKDLQITRVFHAPRADVFACWADAGKLQQWSGCKEATGCEVVMDFRVGGSFTQKMQLQVNGRTCEFKFTGIYDEIVVPERISYHADLGHGFTQVVIQFIEQGDRTKVVLTHNGFADSGARNIVSQGTLESLDKLNLILADQGVAGHRQ